MSSNLQNAKDNLKKGLDYLQMLLDNKEKIKEGLEELSFGVRGDKNLFDYRIGEIYEFIEDNFYPQIKEIEKQINEGKLSKRKYKILIEDSNNGELFNQLLSPITKLINNEHTLMDEVIKNNTKANFSYNKLCDWLDMLRNIIYVIKEVIKYGVEKEDDEYYYLEGSYIKQIFLNEDNGDVLENGNKIGNLKKGNLEYKLFEKLYKSRGKIVSYDELYKHIKGQDKIEKEKNKYIAEKKDLIKDIKIKKLIEVVDGEGYIIR